MKMQNKFSDTYEILGKLGEGSGGIVYKAYHKRLCKEVVLKKMKVRSVSEVINRQEVDILKNLNHSFLPQVFDFLRIDDEVYTVMSYIPGKSFQQLMKEGRRFTKNQLIKWGMQLLSALNYLHSQNPPIIHSDIKPGNIMLTPEGNICLIDFNISFFVDSDTVLGYTNGYSSPEQYLIALDKQSVKSLSHYSTINEKSDIYSVGATLYYLATGLKKENYKDQIDKNALVKAVGEAFAQVIIKSMQIDTEDRYPSAFVMFQAVQGITKKDERYQKLLKKQKGIRLGLVLSMAGFIILTGYGIHEMQLERTEKYNNLVEEQISYRENQEYEKGEEVHEEARSVMPSALESYYQNAYSLYQAGEYAECITFIEYDILENEKIDQHQRRMVDVYYLKAESHFRLKEYEEAVEDYEQMMNLGTLECLHYRDYAIALAYAGKEEKAEEVLQNAIDLGLEDDAIFYAKGEIETALSDWENALRDFENCIECTENEDLKTRSYVLSSEIYERKDKRKEERHLLLKAMDNLKVESQMLVLERFIQVNIDLADTTGESQYREDAIETLHKVVEQGWDTYDTYDNLAILYQKQGDINQAEEILEEMTERYGEDYNIYKRYAFLEIDKQETLSNYDRDYRKFANYYELANQLYYEQLKDNNTDLEMELLDNVYRQVKEGGWL